MASVLFMGTPDFAVPALQRLLTDGHDVVAVVTQPDRPAGRGRVLEMPPVKRFALERGVLVLQPESVNKPEIVAQLQDLHPEVGVVAAFGQILGPAVLWIPAQGHLNVHASLLPRHRGAAPIAAAILAGDEETGVSIMLVEEGLDTGPVLAQERCAILPEDTAESLETRLAMLGADLLSRTLPRWLRRQVTPQPQDDALATFAARVEKEDGRVDWTLPAEVLGRMARAYFPWPGLFAFLGEQRIQLSKVRPLLSWRGEGQPGEVIPGYDDLRVATGQGALLLEEVQLAGKKRVTGLDFKRGQRALTQFR